MPRRSTCLHWLLLHAVAQAASGDSNVVYVTSEERPAYELYNQAVALSRSGQTSAAIDAYAAALDLKEDMPEGHQNIAILLEKVGRVDEGWYHHLQSVKYGRSDSFKSMALVNLAVARMHHGAAVGEGLAERPDPIQLLSSALELDPGNDGALFTLGAVYTDLMQFDKALECFNKGLELNPHNAIGLMNKGNHFFRIHDYNTALRFYRKAVSAGDVFGMSGEDQLLLYNNMGQCFREGGRCDLSLDSFWRARQHFGDNAVNGLWTLSNMLAVQGICSNWSKLEKIEHELHAAVKATIGRPDKSLAHRQAVDPYTHMLQRFVSASDDLALATSNLGCVRPAHVPPPRAASILNREKPIRLGYFSYDWKDHPMGRLTTALVGTHNKSTFSVFCFYIGPPDSSWLHSRKRNFGLTFSKYDTSPQGYFRESCTEFVDLSVVKHDRFEDWSPMADVDALALLRSYELDLLVDLTAHTTGGRMDVSAVHPAGITLNYLGYPGTTGCDGFQYNMVDSVVAPPDVLSGAFSEKLVYLPGTYQANDMPDTVPVCRCTGVVALGDNCCKVDALKTIKRLQDDSASLWGERLSRDLSERMDAVWICAFNANKKMEPISFTAWINILRRLVSKSILVALSASSNSAEQSLRDQARLFGLDPNRIYFIPKTSWLSHLQRASMCDIALDNFVYGAHTTASDLLWQGIPIVSISAWGGTDGRMPSRVSSAMTRAAAVRSPSAGISTDEFKDNEFDGNTRKFDDITITFSAKEFEDTAVRLAGNVKILNYLKTQKIGKHVAYSRAFDKKVHEKSVESAYLQVLDLKALEQNAVISGPMHIVVTPSGASHDCSDRAGGEILVTPRIKSPNLAKDKYVEHSGNVSTSTEDKAVTFDFKHFSSCARALINQNGLPHDVTLAYECIQRPVRESISRTSSSSADALRYRMAALLKDVVIAQRELIGDESMCRYEDVLFKATASYFVKEVSASGPMWKQDLFRQHAFSHWCGAENSAAKAIMDLLSPTLFPGHHHLLVNANVVTICSQVDSIGSEVNRSGGASEDLASYIRNHAVCMLRSQASSVPSRTLLPAVWTFASAVFAEPSNPHSQLMLGVAMEQGGDADGGFLVSSAAVRNQQLLDFENHVVSTADEIRIPSSGGLYVIIYCNEYGNTWWPHWGPHSMQTGAIGGSEEAVIVVAEELALLGHRVEVYADAQQDVGGQENRGVRWFNYREYNPEAENIPDVFIAWRYAISAGGLCPRSQFGHPRTRCVLWLHDIVSPSVLPPALSKEFTDNFIVAVPSAFHKEKIPQHLRKFTRVVMNGISYDALTALSTEAKPCRRSNVFIYASAPNRGLEDVLRSWSRIKQAAPAAVLRVFYGFSSSKDAQLQQMMGMSTGNYLQWKTNVTSMLDQDGVEYVGEVTPGTLLRELARGSFLLYPTRFPEVGCITVMKAMAAGCIPITSRYVNSVLRPSPGGPAAGVGITAEFDLGPTTPFDDRMDYSNWIQEEWVPAVVDAFSRAGPSGSHGCSDNMQPHREAMQRYAARSFSWRESARRFESMFKGS